MSFRRHLSAAAVAIALATAGSAQGATLFSDTTGIPETATNQSFTVDFAGMTGLANLSFILDGYRSLDGQNRYEDDFTLSLNDVAILRGTFNLGGGGKDVVFLKPVGATIDNVSGNGTAVTWTGGHVNISTPLALVDGANTLTFAYNSPGRPKRGFQGQTDEAWGVHDILVTMVGVPEPATWGLMLLGFGSAGVMLRRSRRELVRVAA